MLPGSGRNESEKDLQNLIFSDETGKQCGGDTTLSPDAGKPCSHQVADRQGLPV